MKKFLFFLTLFILTLFILKFGAMEAMAAEKAPRLLFQQDFKGDVSACQKWGYCQLSKPDFKKGLMKMTFTGSDPFIHIDGLDFKPKTGQYVEIRARSNGSGDGELFFSETKKGPYGGFSQKKTTGWTMIHDGKWQVYKIYPEWMNLPKIIQIRIDLGAPKAELVNKSFIEIESIRICDPEFDKAPEIVPVWDLNKLETWSVDQKNGQTIYTSPAFSAEMAQSGFWFYLDVVTGRKASIPEKARGSVRVWSSEGKGLATISFPFRNKSFIYNLDFTDEAFVNGKVHKLEITLPTCDTALREVGFAGNPHGDGALDTIYQGMSEAINRSGQPVKYLVNLKNIGGGTLQELHVCFEKKGNWKDAELLEITQDGKKVTNDVLYPIESMTATELVLSFKSKQPGTFEGSLVLEDGGGPFLHKTPITLKIDPSLNLPKTSYVPEPKPIKTKYELGAYYFPGWSKRDAWNRIQTSQPIRKPVLGWYDESNPEVVDWQIKWASETGIKVFLVDWYWNRGQQHLDHWINAFKQAKYRSYLKWAMMWANHNGPGSHSLEDTEKVTKFWLDNYFNMPEYYTLDGKPVVVIWSPGGMDNDIINIEKAKGHQLKKGEGVRQILDLSRKIAQKAGYKGIHFIAMKFPEASTAASDIQWLADAGFDTVSIYHFMSHGGKAENPRRFSFDLVVDANLPFHEAWAKTGILPFCPNISTGWDSRPWHGEKQTIIEDRTVSKFKRICQEIKTFVDEHGTKELITISPLNEWGEGSYIEPNLEFGFGMYEAIRDTFCEKPAEGFPPYFGPTDIGRGPYDLPQIELPKFHENWSFEKDPDGWRPLMGVEDFGVQNNRLVMKTTNRDPAIMTTFPRIKANDWSKFVIRMKIENMQADNAMELFWIPPGSIASQNRTLSLPIIRDGQFHDYVFDLSKHKLWRGLISGLRFDMTNAPGVKIEIENCRFEK